MQAHPPCRLRTQRAVRTAATSPSVALSARPRDFRRLRRASGRGVDSAAHFRSLRPRLRLCASVLCVGPPSNDVGKSGSRHRQLRCPAQKGRGLTQHRRGMPAEAIESEHHQAAGFGLRTAAVGGGAAASAAAAALHGQSVPAKRTATGDATSCSATP